MKLDLYDIITFTVLFLLILCVGFFTSSETAYISLSKIKLRRMQEEGKKKARIVTKLHGNMPRLLTTVLIGTNFLNALISALATALVVKLSGGGGVGLPTLLTAFVITTFGQIIPKTIAGRDPEKRCLSSCVRLYVLETLFFPIVFLFERLSHGAVPESTSLTILSCSKGFLPELEWLQSMTAEGFLSPFCLYISSSITRSS